MGKAVFENIMEGSPAVLHGLLLVTEIRRLLVAECHRTFSRPSAPSYCAQQEEALVLLGQREPSEDPAAILQA